MDQPQYSSLLAALAQVPDPRCARGKQLEWTMILGVIASGDMTTTHDKVIYIDDGQYLERAGAVHGLVVGQTSFE